MRAEDTLTLSSHLTRRKQLLCCLLMKSRSRQSILWTENRLSNKTHFLPISNCVTTSHLSRFESIGSCWEFPSASSSIRYSAPRFNYQSIKLLLSWYRRRSERRGKFMHKFYYRSTFTHIHTHNGGKIIVFRVLCWEEFEDWNLPHTPAKFFSSHFSSWISWRRIIADSVTDALLIQRQSFLSIRRDKPDELCPGTK